MASFGDHSTGREQELPTGLQQALLRELQGYHGHASVPNGTPTQARGDELDGVRLQQNQGGGGMLSVTGLSAGSLVLRLGDP